MGSKSLEMTSSAHGAERDRLGILAALLVLTVGFVTMFVMVRQGADLGEIKSQLKDVKAQMQEMRQWREHLDSQVCLSNSRSRQTPNELHFSGQWIRAVG